jgi:transposase
MAKRKRRAFTKEFKAETVRLVRESGKSVGAVARELDLTETALREWVRQAEVDAGRGRPGALTTEEREELARLRREVRTLRMERDILKNCPARRGAVPPAGPETRDAAMLTGPREPWPSASWCHREPVKKHGPGVAGALDIGDAARRSRLGK